MTLPGEADPLKDLLLQLLNRCGQREKYRAKLIANGMTLPQTSQKKHGLVRAANNDP
jgi:hypothetical protein